MKFPLSKSEVMENKVHEWKSAVNGSQGRYHREIPFRGEIDKMQKKDLGCLLYNSLDTSRFVEQFQNRDRE